jgi:hypothetical protein
VRPDHRGGLSPSAVSSNPLARFAFSSNEAAVRYECSLDEAPFSPCQEVYEVAWGEHTLRARAVDAAGNVDATPAHHVWRVDEPLQLSGGGCSAVPATPWLGLLALLAAFPARRSLTRNGGRGGPRPACPFPRR